MSYLANKRQIMCSLRQLWGDTWWAQDKHAPQAEISEITGTAALTLLLCFWVSPMQTASGACIQTICMKSKFVFKYRHWRALSPRVCWGYSSSKHSLTIPRSSHSTATRVRWGKGPAGGNAWLDSHWCWAATEVSGGTENPLLLIKIISGLICSSKTGFDQSKPCISNSMCHRYQRKAVNYISVTFSVFCSLSHQLFPLSLVYCLNNPWRKGERPTNENTEY